MTRVCPTPPGAPRDLGGHTGRPAFPPETAPADNRARTARCGSPPPRAPRRGRADDPCGHGRGPRPGPPRGAGHGQESRAPRHALLPWARTRPAAQDGWGHGTLPPRAPRRAASRRTDGPPRAHGAGRLPSTEAPPIGSPQRHPRASPQSPAWSTACDHTGVPRCRRASTPTRACPAHAQLRRSSAQRRPWATRWGLSGPPRCRTAMRAPPPRQCG